MGAVGLGAGALKLISPGTSPGQSLISTGSVANRSDELIAASRKIARWSFIGEGWRVGGVEWGRGRGWADEIAANS